MSALAAQSVEYATSSELTWDGNRYPITAKRLTLTTTGCLDWTPAVLLATAVGASLVTTFAQLAAARGLRIVRYAAQQSATLTEDHGKIAAISITPCITVDSTAAADQARMLWSYALDTAPVVRALECPLICEPHIVVRDTPRPVAATLRSA